MDHAVMNEIGRNAETKPANSARIRAIQAQIADLKKRWPAHSTPPDMMQRLDELEEALENELAIASAS
jgi:hypothetical protein